MFRDLEPFHFSNESSVQRLVTPRSSRNAWFHLSGYLCIAVALLLLTIPLKVLLTQHAEEAREIAARHSTFSLDGIAIKGNRFVTGSGQPITLHGVNYPGFEWTCSHNQELFFPHDASAVRALVSWHINIARVGIAEDCWLGINGLSPQVSGPAFQQAVVNFVNLLHHYGIYVEISLMYVAPGSTVSIDQMPMPDADHAITVWKQVANTFKNDHNVIFGAYGEPQPNSWSCWRDGGPSCNLGYSAVGMQTLVNTIRATGATQPISVSGGTWGGDLSQWLQYEPNDPLHSLSAEWHLYGDENLCNTQACWNSTILPITQRVPVINGELGESAFSNTCAFTFMQTYLAWADAHNVSYEVWKWSPDEQGPCGNMALITNYDGTPSPVYGEGYKGHLAALANS
jgi:Cellulase (glycosyl hydrolase family 5)